MTSSALWLASAAPLLTCTFSRYSPFTATQSIMKQHLAMFWNGKGWCTGAITKHTPQRQQYGSCGCLQTGAEERAVV